MSYQIEIAQKHDAREIEALLNSCFPVPKGASFYEDFPFWNLAGSHSFDTVVAKNQGQIAGFAGGRKADLQVGSERVIPVYLIGAVSTHETHRGVGVASQLIDQLIKKASDQGAGLVILWGSELSIYQKRGFELCGFQLRLALKDLSLDGAHAPIEIQKGFHPKIYSHRDQTQFGLKLRETDQKWFEAHKNVQWRWVEESGKFAFLGFNRGIDLENIIHEWGGDPALCLKLISTVKKENENLSIIGPPEQFDRFGIRTPETLVEYVCLAKILDPNLMGSAIWGDQSGYSFQSMADGGWEMKAPNGMEVEFGAGELVKQFFGPERFEELKELDESAFPVPLWLWGLDSV